MTRIPWLQRREALRRAEDLLAECCERLSLGPKEFGKSGRQWISRRRWGADAAEMRRAVYYAALASRDGAVEAGHFPPRSVRDHEAFAKTSFANMALEEIVGQKVEHFFTRLGNVEVNSVYRAVLDQVERPLIERCLKWADGNQLKAARVLGINRNTLRKKMRELKVKR